MQRLSLAITFLGLLAVPAIAQTSRAPVPGAGVCTPVVKWRVLIHIATSNESVPQCDLPVTTVEFWTLTTAAEQQTETMAVANNGSFGASYIDGHHNTTYTKTFFPPRQVIGARYEFDCLP